MHARMSMWGVRRQLCNVIHGECPVNAFWWACCTGTCGSVAVPSGSGEPLPRSGSDLPATQVGWKTVMLPAEPTVTLPTADHRAATYSHCPDVSWLSERTNTRVRIDTPSQRNHLDRWLRLHMRVRLRLPRMCGTPRGTARFARPQGLQGRLWLLHRSVRGCRTSCRVGRAGLCRRLGSQSVAGGKEHDRPVSRASGGSTESAGEPQDEHEHGSDECDGVSELGVRGER